MRRGLLIFLFGLFVAQACEKDRENAVENRTTKCDIFFTELVDGYISETWNEESILDFIQGEWLLDTIICSPRVAFCNVDNRLPPDFWIDIRADTLKVFGTSMNEQFANSKFSLSLNGKKTRYKLDLDVNANEFGKYWGYFVGDLIPCKETLVLYATNRDGEDYYFRKM